MRDLDERLHGIDRLSPPDLLSEARVKAEGSAPKRSGVAMGSTRRLATIVVALVIGLGALVVLVPAFDRNDQEVTPVAPVRERIVFSSVMFPDVPGQVYSMAPDGSNLFQLTRGTGSYSSVSVSPDGTRLAYVHLDQEGSSGGGPGPEAIFVANSDGTDPTEVFRSTETPQSLVALQWSPDGRSLGFILRSIPPGGGSEADWGSQLWVMSAEGSDPHPVSDQRIASFSWSPTGDRFAVTRESVAGDRFVDDIYVIGLDGSNVARLTSQGASRNPIWSPDGERIMFAEGWMPEGHRVMVMRADGSEVEPLPLRYEGWVEPLAWAPDSRSVLVGGGSSQHDCTMLLASASGETSVLLEGTTPLATQHLEPGETPAATGDPCVQSASWTPWSTTAVPTAEDIVEGRAPIGEPLAELLGLKLEPSFEAAPPCAYWQGVGEAGGYCLADLDAGEIDTYAIAVALRGHRITQDELAAITDAFSGQGLGVDDAPIAKIPIIQERIASVRMELASLDATTPEGRALEEVLTAQLAAFETALVDLCQEAGSPGICLTP